MFRQLQPYPGDPILSLNEAFQADTRANKANLGIGVYLEADGRVPTMAVVRQAAARIQPTQGPFPYLPMEGDRRYRGAVQRLLFGSQAAQGGHIATVQTLGGSGALKVAGDFLRFHLGPRTVYVSNPTWDNHRSIFQGCGFEVMDYTYFDERTGRVDFDGMQQSLESMPDGSIVILHACCHNPTGADLSTEQWDAVAALVMEKSLLPLVDIAYQGFGAGIEEDTYALKALQQQNIAFLVANSFSKNFALYGERCGALSVVCTDEVQADLVLGQLKSTIRKNYSNPPTFGCRLIAEVLDTPELNAQWSEELAEMRSRILRMRQRLFGLLSEALPNEDFARLVDQTGMFTYTGLSVEQVRHLRQEHGVYLLETGRMCMAALSALNVEYVAASVASTLRTVATR